MDNIVILSKMGETPAVRILASRIRDYKYNVSIDSRPISFVRYKTLKEDELYGGNTVCVIVFLTKDMIKGFTLDSTNYLNDLLASLKAQFFKVIPIVINQIIFEHLNLGSLYIDATSSFSMSSVSNRIIKLIDPENSNPDVSSSFQRKLSELLSKEPQLGDGDSEKRLRIQYEEIQESMRKFRIILTSYIEPVVFGANDLMKRTLGLRLRVETDVYENENINKHNFMMAINRLNYARSIDKELREVRQYISISLIKGNLVIFNETPNLLFECFMKKNKIRVVYGGSESYGDVYDLDEVDGTIIENAVLDFITEFTKK